MIKYRHPYTTIRTEFESAVEAALREKILDTVRAHPGIRKREIAGYIDCNVFNIITLLYKMCDEGVLEYHIYRDFANMEYYEQYFVKGV